MNYYFHEEDLGARFNNVGFNDTWAVSYEGYLWVFFKNQPVWDNVLNSITEPRSRILFNGEVYIRLDLIFNKFLPQNITSIEGALWNQDFNNMDLNSTEYHLPNYSSDTQQRFAGVSPELDTYRTKLAHQQQLGPNENKYLFPKGLTNELGKYIVQKVFHDFKISGDVWTWDSYKNYCAKIGVDTNTNSQDAWKSLLAIYTSNGSGTMTLLEFEQMFQSVSEKNPRQALERWKNLGFPDLQESWLEGALTEEAEIQDLIARSSGKNSNRRIKPEF